MCAQTKCKANVLDVQLKKQTKKPTTIGEVRLHESGKIVSTNVKYPKVIYVKGVWI